MDHLSRHEAEMKSTIARFFHTAPYYESVSADTALELVKKDPLPADINMRLKQSSKSTLRGTGATTMTEDITNSRDVSSLKKSLAHDIAAFWQFGEAPCSTDKASPDTVINFLCGCSKTAYWALLLGGLGRMRSKTV